MVASGQNKREKDGNLNVTEQLLFVDALVAMDLECTQTVIALYPKFTCRGATRRINYESTASYPLPSPSATPTYA